MPPTSAVPSKTEGLLRQAQEEPRTTTRVRGAGAALPSIDASEAGYCPVAGLSTSRVGFSSE